MASNPVRNFIVLGYDDWHGLFIDGVLEDEGHEIPFWMIARLSRGLPITFDTITDERLTRYFSEYGRFRHQTLAEVQAELDGY